MLPRIPLTSIFIALFLSLASAASAQLINVNFAQTYAGKAVLGTTSDAWNTLNNPQNGASTPIGLLDSAGSSSGVTLTYTTGFTYSGINPAGSGYNPGLFKSYAYTNTGSSATMTLFGLAANSAYHLIFYGGNGIAGANGRVIGWSVNGGAVKTLTQAANSGYVSTSTSATTYSGNYLDYGSVSSTAAGTLSIVISNPSGESDMAGFQIERGTQVSPSLVSVNFASPYNGPAVVGQPGDTWNTFTNPQAGYATPAPLATAAGYSSGAKLTFTTGFSYYGVSSTGYTPALFKGYAYSTGGNSVTMTLSGLTPNGSYKIYFLGGNGFSGANGRQIQWSVNGGPTVRLTQATSASYVSTSTGTNTYSGNFINYGSVSASGTGTISILVGNPAGESDMIGFQIEGGFAPPPPPLQQLVNVNFVSGYTGAAVLGTAQDTWNTFTSPQLAISSPASLADSDGNASGVSLTYTTGFTYGGYSGSGATPGLFKGYAYTNTGSSVTMSLSGLIANGKYRIIFYGGNGISGANGRVIRWSVNGGVSKTLTQIANTGFVSTSTGATSFSGNYIDYGTINADGSGHASIVVSNSSGESDMVGFQLEKPSDAMYGVNLAGGEFGPLPGSYGTDYTYPTEAEFSYYQSKGLTLIRLPFLWERLQPTLGGNLNTAELARLDDVLDLAAVYGMKVILDMHNYGRYNGNLIGSAGVSYANFGDAWNRIATHYVSDPAVYGYGIMNEPHDTANTWYIAAQQAVDSIRLVDTKHIILVSGDGWSSAEYWAANNPNLNITDPANNIIYEAHCYFDGNSSGTYAQTYDQQGAYPEIGVDRVRPFITWLQQRNAKGLIGEYGVPNNDARWNTILDKFLTHLRDNSVAGTYWAGGPWWGTYPLSCEPTSNFTIDASQMSVLSKYHQ